MKTIKQLAASAIIACCIMPLLNGCAAKKNIYGDPGSGFVLEYQMQKGMPYQYDLVSDFTTTMEVRGQKYNVESDSRNMFTMVPAGSNNGNFQYRVTIDTAYMHFKSPQGEMNPEISQVIGRDFLFEVTPKGREVDCSGAEELKYNLGEYEEMNLSSDFKTLFPDLPDRRVKPGETWHNTDTLVEKGKSGFLEFVTHNAHAIESMEKFEGYDCLKIRTLFSGTLKGEGDLQGARTKTEGTISGELTWYFAYKEGIFVSITSAGRAESTTTASIEGNGISIPTTRDFNSVISLVSN